MTKHGAIRPGARDTVEVLRVAVEVLLIITRNMPRGPWCWGDAQTGHRDD
jgi:hypothetical protein